MNMKVLVTLVLCLFISGIATANGGVAYDASVTLENKDANWDVLTEDGISATVQYNASGDAFTWRAVGTVPNHAGEVAECYALIYYADEDDRFVNWGGANPGACIGTFQVNACTGNFDSGDQTIDLDMNMPEYPDFNGNPDPWDTYCNEEGDNYTHCCGAKLWVVPCDDYETPAMTAWNPDDYLFETDLIWYDDTNADNKEPRIENVDIDACYQAGDEITITVRVCDKDGIGDLNAMIVTGNFSEYGVEELVEFTIVDCENGDCDHSCICREYEGTVVITKATVHECEDDRNHMEFEPRVHISEPEFSYLIIATDPAGDSDYRHDEVDIEPGPCDHMKFHNGCDYDGEEELRTVALTQLSHCDTKDYPKWWSHADKFGIYMIRYTTHLYDEYDNHISCIYKSDCCEGFDPEVTGTDVSLKFDEGEYSRVIMINENNPGEATLTVNCLYGDVPSISQTVEFLNPIASIDVTANVDAIYCNDEDELNITAQIVDLYGDPIPMPGVEVILYIDNAMDYDGETDENGIVTFEVEFEPPEEGSVTFRCWSECRGGSLTLDVVEPVLECVELTPEDNEVECGDEQEITATCYSDHDTEMCCPCDVVWTCTDLGEIESCGDEGYFTALDSGTCTVTADVCGVIGTVDVTINCPENCTKVGPGEAFIVTSGSVSITGNFTEEGSYACVAALGDPMEGDDDIRGAIVDASENVTLDLAGDGDTWIQNETTGNWSLYAMGPISVSMDRHVFALVAIPEPEPEPEPTPTARRSGGSGGGLYPTAPTNNTTVVNTTEPEPEAEPTPEPTEKLPVRPGSVTIVTDDGEEVTITVDEDGNWLPGFSGIIAVLGLLSIAYIVNRRRD